MQQVNAARAEKTVGDPNGEYESLKPLWARCRAVIGGERHAKLYDSVKASSGNLLIPFSPSMTDDQYSFYKEEAELPGIVSQFTKMLAGGLLRKQPSLKLPDGLPEDAFNWIMHEIGQDDSALASVLDSAIFEELQTSRSWIYVDHPTVSEEDLVKLDPEEVAKIKPYPVLWKAEHVINWRTKKDMFGKIVLDRLITREFVEKFTEKNEFHPSMVDTVKVHEIVDDYYQIRVFERTDDTKTVTIVNGQRQSDAGKTSPKFELKETITDILIGGERLKFIPAWPLNGAIDAAEPILTSLIDKEVALYNKISRRNHLLLGAATYTPVITSDMTDEEFDDVVSEGLGSWLRLRPGDTATVLETPTAALADMDRAIAAGIEEMARLGIRMLSPETAQSGIALEIRNAAQNAQLGTLNTRVSNTMKQIIAFLLSWRYQTVVNPFDIVFELSSDFNPMPVGADWLRLATEWYQGGLIPRSAWLQMLKQNDMLPADYNDDVAQEEINQDELIVTPADQNQQYLDQINMQNELAAQQSQTTPQDKGATK